MNRMRKTLIGTALTGSTLLGGALGAALIIGSATAQTTPTDAAAQAPAAAPAPGTQPQGRGFDPARGGHTGHNGVREELLTGDTAAKVKAAALAAVPGGTVQRVENDAEGSPYEAHMSKADGTQVTVKVDSGFKVTSVDNGAR